MNIIELLQQDNIKTSHVAATNGGEFHSACPKCFGKDRFLSWPNDRPEKGGKFYCRQCKFLGNAITYLIEIRGMKFKDACLELGIQPEFKFNSKPKAEETFRQIWEPRTINQVSQRWSDKAEAVLFSAFKTLLSPAGKSTRGYLLSRGISTNTIKQARIGLILSDLSFDRSSWGLPLPDKKDASNHQIWVPAGIIIPMFSSGRVVRLRIRQDNPKKSDRYILVAGSATAYLQHNQIFNPNIPSMVIESELDGWLVYQEASMVNVFSIGNSSARPDIETHSKIKQTPILISLDHDQAGKGESLWWQKQYPNSLVWPSIQGKDPGEDYQAGVSLKSWVTAGRDALLSGKKVEVEANKEIKKEDEPAKEQIEQAEKSEEPQDISLIFKQTITCLHNKPCVNLSHIKTERSIFEKPVCLLRDNRKAEEEMDSITSIYSMTSCPKNKWKRVDDKDCFYQIIIEVEREVKK